MKKRICLAIAVLIVAMMIVFGIPASAAGNSINDATAIVIGQSYTNQTLTETNRADFYEFNLDSAGKVTLDVSAYFCHSEYFIYDAQGDQIWHSGWCEWNENTNLMHETWAVHLIEGVYYLKVKSPEDYDTGKYSFKVDFESASESFGEPNNTLVTADAIAFKTSYTGQLALNDREDFYKFNLDSAGKVTLDVSAYFCHSEYFIYDAQGDQVWHSGWCEWNENTNLMHETWGVHLTKGVYYLKVKSPEDYDTGKYTFKLTYVDAKETFNEPQGGDNNTIGTADAITLNKTYNSQLAINDHEDFFKFTMNTAGVVKLNSTNYIPYGILYIYDSENNLLLEHFLGVNENSSVGKDTHTLSLKKGTYYIRICKNDWYDETTGNVSFSLDCVHSWKTVSIVKATLTGDGKLNQTCGVCGKTQTVMVKKVSSFKLSATSYTYDGKVKSPTVTVKDSAGKNLKKGADYTVTYASGRTNAGSYTVTVKMIGNYSGSKTLTFKIDPVKIDKCKVTLAATSYTYDGKVKNPAVTVKTSAGKTLKKDTDYTVKYASGCKEAGTYKVTVTMKGNYSSTKTLTFKINPVKINKCKVTLAATSYTYDGKVKNPAVTVKTSAGKTLKKGTDYTMTYASGCKNVGTYKVTIKMKGNYSGTKTLTFKINAPKTTVSKLTAGKKAFTVAVTKKSGISGYQIQYSTSKSFASATSKTITGTKLTVKNLKAATTYYVRVRTYKTVNGKKVYSDWSAAKSVKTKK